MPSRYWLAFYAWLHFETHQCSRFSSYIRHNNQWLHKYDKKKWVIFDEMCTWFFFFLEIQYVLMRDFSVHILDNAFIRFLPFYWLLLHFLFVRVVWWIWITRKIADFFKLDKSVQQKVPISYCTDIFLLSLTQDCLEVFVLLQSKLKFCKLPLCTFM